MAYAETDLLTAVRAECGKATSTTELADTDIKTEYGFILQRIAEKIAVKVLRSVTGKTDVREYDVHANTVRVQKIFRWDDTEENLMVLGGYKAEEAERDERYNFPSLWVIEQMRRLRGLPKVQFTFNPVEKKLKIDPMPEEDDNKYYYISIEHASWTLANLPEDFKELLVLGTAWKCLEIVMLKRSNLGGQLRAGGFVDFPAISLKGYIESKRDEFFRMLDTKAMLYNL